jgi:hypothetical protein
VSRWAGVALLIVDGLYLNLLWTCGTAFSASHDTGQSPNALGAVKSGNLFNYLGVHLDREARGLRGRCEFSRMRLSYAPLSRSLWSLGA